MHDEQLEAINDWIEAQGEKISRPEAIRRAWAEGEEMSAAETSAYPLMAGGRRTEMFSVQSVL
jgi:hypothetical protein